MHREPLDQLATIDRLAAIPAGLREPLALDAKPHADATPHDGDDDLSRSETRPLSALRASATRRVLTPAVERVLAWHQRRGA